MRNLLAILLASFLVACGGGGGGSSSPSAPAPTPEVPEVPEVEPTPEPTVPTVVTALGVMSIDGSPYPNGTLQYDDGTYRVTQSPAVYVDGTERNLSTVTVNYPNEYYRRLTLHFIGRSPTYVDTATRVFNDDGSESVEILFCTARPLTPASLTYTVGETDKLLFSGICPRSSRIPDARNTITYSVTADGENVIVTMHQLIKGDGDYYTGDYPIHDEYTYVFVLDADGNIIEMI